MRDLCGSRVGVRLDLRLFPESDLFDLSPPEFERLSDFRAFDEDRSRFPRSLVDLGVDPWPLVLDLLLDLWFELFLLFELFFFSMVREAELLSFAGLSDADFSRFRERSKTLETNISRYSSAA